MAVALFVLAAASLSPHPSASGTGLEPKDALTILLTAESLLFAAFGISVTLTAKTQTGLPAFLAQGYLAWWITLAITVVGVGAGAAWLAVYRDSWPDDVISWFICVAIAAGVVLEAFLAVLISYYVTKDLRA